MALYIVSVMMYLVEIIKYAVTIQLCFKEEIHYKWQMAAGMVFYLLGAVFISYDIHMMNVWRFTVVSVAVLWGMDTKIWKRLAYILFCLFEITCLDQIFEFFIRQLTNNQVREILGIHFSSLITSLCTLLILLVVLLIQRKWTRKFFVANGAGVYIAVGIMGISMLLALAMLGEVNTYISDNRFGEVCEILIPIASASVGLLGWLIIYIKNINEQLKNHLEVEQILNQTKENYHQLLQEKESNTRAFRHDMVNHMVCLHALLADKDEKAAMEYLEKLQEQMLEIQKKCYITGNQIIDAILNYYLSALDKTVLVEVQGQCTKALQISDADLCIIVANLVQNAAEAVKRENSENPYVRVGLYTGSANMRLSICNSTEDQRKLEKGKLPESVKANRQNHGMGLRNVIRTVNRNDGTIDIEKENGEFRTVLILPLQR